MTEKAGESSYGSAKDWADIIKGASEGAGASMQSAASTAHSKEQAKEAKRRTLTNLVNKAMKRNRDLFRSKQEHGDEMSDYQAQAMQEMARGFVKGTKGGN